MRCERTSGATGGAARWIKSATDELHTAIDRLLLEIRAQQTPNGEWAGVMPGGPLQLGWSLLAELECMNGRENPPRRRGLPACHSALVPPFRGFPATEGDPPDEGVTRSLRAVLGRVRGCLADQIPKNLWGLLDAALVPPDLPEGATSSRFYSQLGDPRAPRSVGQRWLGRVPDVRYVGRPVFSALDAGRARPRVAAKPGDFRAESLQVLLSSFDLSRGHRINRMAWCSDARQLKAPRISCEYPSWR
jgi:hypothetical protein